MTDPRICAATPAMLPMARAMTGRAIEDSHPDGESANLV